MDLSKSELRLIEVEKGLAAAFIGGRGLGVKVVYDHAPRRASPLHPSTPLVFAVGPLTATCFPSSSRACVVSKSPLTGTIFDSNVGGGLGLALRKTGLDAIIVLGSSKELLALVIDEGEPRLVDASWLKGSSTKDTLNALRKDLGEDFEVACVGPAGENAVRLACICAGRGHVAGRGGLGAVMGGRGLKALAVRGSREVEVADEEGLRRLSLSVARRLRSNPITGKALPNLGTSFLLAVVNEHGMLPSYNYSRLGFEEAYRVSAESYAVLHGRRRPCPGCFIACKRDLNLDGLEVPQPEFESIWSLGPLCGLADPAKVAELNELCNELGLDSISMGATLACYIELSQRGLVEERVEWGDAEAMRRLIEDAAHRRGAGSKLAEGSRRLAEAVGLPEASVSVKGLELPAYDPRAAYGQALSYATSNRGGCHLRAYLVASELLGVPILLDRLSALGKADLVAHFEDLMAAVDSLIVCKFLALELDDEVFAEALRHATGLAYDRASFMEAGERIWNLERLFNLEEGFDLSHDTLPERVLKDPRAPPLSEMLREYYEARGWTIRGEPRRSKLEKLGLPGDKVKLGGRGEGGGL